VFRKTPISTAPSTITTTTTSSCNTTSPAPAPEAAVSQVNPQVRRAKSKKAKGEYAQGSSQLRVPLKPSVNTGASGPAGGLNK